jgi:radical SAM-linked protein
LRYAKRGPGRFASHRDFARAFERALRRAHVPMEYSSGFHPHPRVSWANPAATGAESEAEYVEIGLAERLDVEEIRQAVDAALPPGFAVVAAAEGVDVAAGLEASEWVVTWEEPRPAVPRSLSDAGFAPVTRQTKNGPRTFDVTSAVVALQCRDDGLRLVLRHTTPLVRPDDVVAALGVERAGLVRRVAQGRLVEGQVVAPF